MKSKYIIIAGNIATGKTTLTSKLAKELNFTPIYEKVDNNPYLEDFYKDMKRYAFPLQIYFLKHRFTVHRQITEEGKNIIQDRSVFEDAAVFAKNLYINNLLDDRDFDNYNELYKIMSNYFKIPDLVIYLYADTDTLLQRIKLRGREYEQSIEKSYLESINYLYEEWISSFTLCPIIKINSSLNNFYNTDTINNLLNRISKLLSLELLQCESIV